MQLNIRPEGRNLQPTETDPGLRRDGEEKNRHPELGSGSQTPTVIIANRLTDDIQDVKDKVYTRDLFGKD